LVYHREETRIATAIEAVRQQKSVEGNEERLKSELEVRFEEVARVLADLLLGEQDVDRRT